VRLRRIALTLGAAGMLTGGVLASPVTAAPTTSTPLAQTGQQQPRPREPREGYGCCGHHFYYYGWGPPGETMGHDYHGWWVHHDGHWDRVPQGRGCGYWQSGWRDW
jgi:hypothetical protein